MSQRFEGLFNQAGMFAPPSGEQAETFRELPGVSIVYYPTNVRGSTPDPRAAHGEAGNVGNWSAQGAALVDRPVPLLEAYFGLAPAAIQPDLVKPDPWTDPG